MAEQYAKEYNIPVIIYNAQWNKYGKSAGPKRNKLIVNDSNKIIAFVSPNSIGTLITIQMAKDQNIPVDIFYIKSDLT